jgi:hypothetical protein
MALKSVFKPSKFAALFDTYDVVYDNLDEIGVKVEVLAKAFSVLGPNDENIIGNIGLNQGAVAMAQAGNLPNIAKAPVKVAIKAAFKHALKSSNWKHEVTVDDIVDEDDVADLINEEPLICSTDSGKQFKKKFEESLMSKMVDEKDDDIAAKIEVESTAFKDIDIEKNTLSADDMQEQDEAILSHSVFGPNYANKVTTQYTTTTASEGLNMPKVALKDAESMYQPVGSTSNESVYHVVGMTKTGLKFAARRNEQSLSVRVEGKVEAYKNHLIAAGFNESYISKGYTSVHFHGVDDLMAARALGAVLLGTEQPFVTPMPDLDVIAGKGI